MSFEEQDKERKIEAEWEAALGHHGSFKGNVSC